MPSWRRKFSSLVVVSAIVAVAPVHADEHASGVRLRVPRSLRLEVDQLKKLSLTIAPQRGYSISRDGPVVVRITPPEQGLRIAKTRYRRQDAADPLADAPRFEVRVRGTAAGQREIGVDVFFWLCRKRTCRPVRRQLSVRATVVEPPPPSETSPDAGPGGDAGSSLAPGGG